MTFASGSVRFLIDVITDATASRNSCDAAIVAPTSMAAWHGDVEGMAKQFSITSSNPTSLPPTVTVTTFAVVAIVPTCATVSTVDAPEQAGNDTSRSFASASSSFG